MLESSSSGFRIATAVKCASSHLRDRHQRHRQRDRGGRGDGQKTSCTIPLSSGLTEDMIKAAQEKNARTQLARVRLP